MKCFKCPKDYDDINSLIAHLKNKHRVQGEARCICTLCFKLLGKVSVFKRHVEICSMKNGMVTDEQLYNSIIGFEFNEDLERWSDSLKAFTLNLTLKLCATPNFPRNAAFDIIQQFQLFIKEITNGLENVMMRNIEDRSLLESFISTLESSFDRMTTESSFKTLLKDLDLVKPFIKIDVASNMRLEGKDDDNDDNDDDDYEDDENGDEVVKNIERPKCTLVIMPLAFQIKQFLEMPNVFAKIQAHVAAIEAQPTLNHFIKGSVWKEKLKEFDDGAIVIPYNFYGDGVQVNNLLGPHTASGLQNFDYITFPTVPTEYQSRLSNIMVAAMFEEKTIKAHGTAAVFGHIIPELTDLALNGIVLNINNQPTKVYLLMGLYEGDNKDCNRSLDYPDSHNAIYYCRFCRMSKPEMQTATEERVELLRTVDNYNQDVDTNNMTQTGVCKWSIFNSVPHFHVVNGTTNETHHDLLEGTLPYSLCGGIRLLSNEGYFTLDELNKQIKQFNYGPDNCANKPPPISKRRIDKSKKIKMNAAEMFNFAHNITFLVGGQVPEVNCEGEQNHLWEFVKNVVKLLDVCYLPWYEPEDLVTMSAVVKILLENYQELVECLKPVFHYLTHYVTNTKRYGPLRRLQVLRKEGKHKEIKMYTKNSNNRINIPVSVANKVQYNIALCAISSAGFKDVVTTNKLHEMSIKDKVYYRNIEASRQKDTISSNYGFFTNKVVVNGTTFTTDSWLPDFTRKDMPIVYQVGDIIIMDPADISSIYLICKLYEKILYEDHFVAYSVDLDAYFDETSKKLFRTNKGINSFLKMNHKDVDDINWILKNGQPQERIQLLLLISQVLELTANAAHRRTSSWLENSTLPHQPSMDLSGTENTEEDMLQRNGSSSHRNEKTPGGSQIVKQHMQKSNENRQHRGTSSPLEGSRLAFRSSTGLIGTENAHEDMSQRSGSSSHRNEKTQGGRQVVPLQKSNENRQHRQTSSTLEDSILAHQLSMDLSDAENAVGDISQATTSGSAVHCDKKSSNKIIRQNQRSSRNNEFFFNLNELLESDVCADINLYYDEHKRLDEVNQKKLMKIMCDELLKGPQASNEIISQISSNVCMVFLTESKESYYNKKPGGAPTGIFYNMYRNKLRKPKNVEGTSRKRKAQDDPNLEANNLDAYSDEVKESVNFFKSVPEETNSEIVYNHWCNSYNFRRAALSKKTNKNVTYILDNWPIVKTSPAQYLIDSDFLKNNGSVCNKSLIENWKYMVMIVDDLHSMISKSNKKIRLLLSQIPTKDTMYDNVVLAKALHFLIPPRSTSETGVTFTSSMEESYKSFYQYARGRGDLNKKMETRIEHWNLKKIEPHPIIFGMIDDTEVRYVVILRDIRLNFNDFVTALDAVFKMIKFCNIPYPPESSKFWSIINGVFYKLRDGTLTGKMCTTIRSINHLIEKKKNPPKRSRSRSQSRSRSRSQSRSRSRLQSRPRKCTRSRSRSSSRSHSRNRSSSRSVSSSRP